MKKIENIDSLILKYAESEIKDMLLIGKNASAKTYLLEKIISTLKTQKQVYYINVFNKSMNFDEKSDKECPDLNDLLESRLEGSNTDWFGDIQGSVFFSDYFYKHKELLEAFFDGKINIKISEEEDLFEINGTSHPKLSTGHQGIFRMILEVFFALEQGVSHIFIDEICKNLDNENAYKIIKFIKEGTKEYLLRNNKDDKNKDIIKILENVNFIITTHSSDVILGAKDFHIVLINNDRNDVNEKSVEIYLSNNYNDDISTKRKFFSTDTEDIDSDFLVTLEAFYSKLINDRVPLNAEEFDKLSEINSKISINTNISSFIQECFARDRCLKGVE